MLTEKTFDTGTRKVHYVEGPEAGPPLVFVHGASWDWRVFLPVLPHFLHRYHVYALDLPGHGQTDPAEEDYNWQAYAQDIVPFIEAHLSEPAALVGHSLGGMVGIIAAAQAPSLFRALVVGDSPLFWEGMAQNFPVDPKQEALARRRLNEPVSIEDATHEMSHFFDLNDPWYRLFSRALFQCDPAGQLGMLEALASKDKFTQGYDCETLLPQIRCPILLVQGDPDAPGPLSGLLMDHEIERAKALHPRVSAERIEGEWHALGMDNWNVIPFVRSITLFLETL